MYKNILILIFLFGNILAQAQSDTLSLLFVGDVMGHDPQIKSAYDPVSKTYNYDPVFKYVKPIIEKADFAIANLEVTLPGAPPYAGYPNFKSPDALAHALKNAGFDFLVTANNHSNDGGKKALEHTIDVVKNLGMYQTGTFKNASERAAYYPLIVYKNNFKLAFLNYTYGTNGIADTPPNIVNMIDEDIIKKDMEDAALFQPDAIIVLIHWGKEYELNENEEQRTLAGKIFQWGADLIIGAHPHVVQPIQSGTITRPDGTQESTLITYSLGNFISNQKKVNTDGGLIFEVDLIKNYTKNTTTIGEHHFIPVWRYVDKTDKKKKYGTYHALPIAAFESDDTNFLNMPAKDKNKMAAFASTTREHLKKSNGTERLITIEQLGIVNGLMTNEDSLTYRIKIGAFMGDPIYMPFEDVVIEKKGELKIYYTKNILGKTNARKKMNEMAQKGFRNVQLEPVKMTPTPKNPSSNPEPQKTTGQ